MKHIPYDPRAYDLMHQGSIALARVESVGMRVDVAYLEGALDKTQRRIKRKQEILAKSDVMKIWRDRFKSRTNFNSNDQLGAVLFEEMGHKKFAHTTTGHYKTDEDSLSRVDDPFVRRYLAIKKLQKGVQFLKGIQEEVCDGFLHPVFNLHIARTFRSSSDSPNFQNIPVRNEWLKNLIRKCIRARRGCRLIEIDYSGIEVRVSCCYHRDPRMDKYIKDPTTDMHRDMAMECYILPKEEVNKQIRYSAKNQFVFPQFYGAWWFDCAAGLWMMIDKLQLKTEKSGIPLRDHLQQHGIKRLGAQNRDNPHPKPGTFEEHIQKVERRFWEKRFPVYSRWKKEWYADYLERGWIKTLTGFICQGHMSRNDVINYPVQCSAFHCLLQVFIWLVNEELDRRRMKAQVIGQIHDSIVADVPDEEMGDYIALVRRLMIERLPDVWSWITVPLDVEVEATPVGGSWVEKEVVKT